MILSRLRGTPEELTLVPLAAARRDEMEPGVVEAVGGSEARHEGTGGVPEASSGGRSNSETGLCAIVTAQVDAELGGALPIDLFTGFRTNLPPGGTPPSMPERLEAHPQTYCGAVFGAMRA
jgi:hypothetical protein